MKKTLVPIAVLALSVLTAPVAFAQEPADCAAATVALQTAKTDHDKAVADDKKAEEARDADRAFERADRDFERAKKRLDNARAAVVPDEKDDPAEEIAELRSAEKNFDQASKERDRARTKADKTNADQLQRVADRTDAAALKKVLDEAQDDVNRLCGGATTTPSPTPEPEDDIDCDEVSGPEAQRILDADRSDPNNLDNDHDGIACDVDEVPVPGDPAPADPGVVVNNNVAVPSGGVATGGGPAWAFK